MGPDTQTTDVEQADAFFARFTNPTPEVIAQLTAERGGNLAAVTAEDKAYGYWARTLAARAKRRTSRERTTRTAEIAAATRTAHPNESARLAPLSPESVATLPPRRLPRRTESERRATATYWRHLTNPDTARILTSTLQREARTATEHARRAAKAERLAAEKWRLEQRAFERAQWRQVLAANADRRRRQVANRWSAISEQRALEIALAALTEQRPPQARK